MQALLISADDPTEISFKVGIAGTVSRPTKVMVVLERDGKSLSFQAGEVAEGWTATLKDVVGTFSPGPANFAIHVLLNSKLFVPMKGQAEIAYNNAVAAPAVTPTIEPIVTPTIEPIVTPTVTSLVKTFSTTENAKPPPKKVIEVPDLSKLLKEIKKSQPKSCTPHQRLQVRPAKAIFTEAKDYVSVSHKEVVTKPQILTKIKVILK